MGTPNNHDSDVYRCLLKLWAQLNGYQSPNGTETGGRYM